jgi:hypothetical protein
MSGSASTKRARGRFWLDGTVDIECASWDRMVSAVLYSPSRGSVAVRTPDELVDELLRAGGVWWAHWGGNYDTLQVAEVFERRGIHAVATMAGSTVSRFQGGGLTLIDSRFLVPFDLDTASEIAGKPPIGDLAYDEIRAWTADIEAHCAADAQRLYEILAALVGHAQATGLELRGTLGGTAWATAKARLGLPDAEWRSSTWTRIRRAGYAGRNTVTRPTAPSGVHYDIASAYPAALATTPVPCGPMEELGRKATARAFRERRPGMYRATVRVPDDSWLPPLPWRHGPTGKIGYPTGQVTGTWALPELEAALERGVEIESLRSSIVWSRAEVIYSELMREWFDVRAKVGKGTVLGEWRRLLANAFTGKLDEQPDREMLVHLPREVRYCDPSEDRARRAGCTLRRCTGDCGAMRQADRHGRWWAVRYYRQAPSAHVHHAAYLKAATRIRWLEAAERAGETLCQGDTDSLWLADTRELEAQAPLGAGDDLGQWTLKGRFAELAILAPKSYRYVNERGEVVCKAAGAKIDDARWRALLSGDRVVDQRGVMALREALLAGGSLFRRRSVEVRLPHTDGWYGDRLCGPDRFTYPVDRGQLEERWDRRRNPPPAA